MIWSIFHSLRFWLQSCRPFVGIARLFLIYLFDKFYFSIINIYLHDMHIFGNGCIWFFASFSIRKKQGKITRVEGETEISSSLVIILIRKIQ